MSKILKNDLLKCSIFLSGSFPLSVYLPESDVDVAVFIPELEDNDLKGITDIMLSFFEAIKETNDLCLQSQFDNNEHKIQSVEFVNARIKVARCIINKVSVDITVNQRAPLATAVFLEEADRLIGCDHLYKRSVLVVKVCESCTSFTL